MMKLTRLYYNIALNLKENAGEAEKNPTSPAPYINMARALSRISEFATALTVLESGLEHIPGNTGLLYAKLLVYLQNGDKTSAKDLMYKLEAGGFKVDAKIKQALQ